MTFYEWFVRSVAFLLIAGVVVPFGYAMWSGDWRWLTVTGLCLITLSMG